MPVRPTKNTMKFMKVMKAKRAKKAMTEEESWAWSVANDPSEDLSPDEDKDKEDALVDSDADDDTNDDYVLSEMAKALRKLAALRKHADLMEAALEKRAKLRQWKDPAATLRKLTDLMDRQDQESDIEHNPRYQLSTVEIMKPQDEEEHSPRNHRQWKHQCPWRTRAHSVAYECPCRKTTPTTWASLPNFCP